MKHNLRKSFFMILIALLFFLAVALRCLPVMAQGPPQTFRLPDGNAGEAYHANIEEILRDNYGLRIDTGMRSSILHWSAIDAELPKGLSVEPDGTIAGRPITADESPYHFRVKVADLAGGSSPLFIDLIIRIGAPAIRLVKVGGPILESTLAYFSGPHAQVTTDVMPSGMSVLLKSSIPTLVRSNNQPLLATDKSASVIAYEAARYQDSSAVSSLFQRRRGGDVTLTINTPATSVPKAIQVKNGSKVKVSGTQRPVDTCVVATKREELKEESNPLAQLLKVIVGFGAFGVGDVRFAEGVAGEPLFCPDPSFHVPGDAEAQQVESEIRSIRQSLFTNIIDIKTAQTNYKGLAERIRNFASCKGADGITDICTSARFEGEKQNLRSAVDNLLGQRLPVVASTELQLATLTKVLGDRYKKPAAASDEQWLQAVNERLDCFSRNLAYAKRNLDALASANTDLEKFADLLNAHRTKFDYEQILLADANSKVTGTLTCTNFFTKQISGDTVPFTITYQDLPRATVSAGIVFSLLNKRQIGTQPVRTGTAADGTPTFHLTFAETDKSRSQVIPFSFFNYYLTGTRKLNLNASAGVGLNPNNGSNQVEYFVGGALGLKNVYLQLGGHLGRWQELQGGFSLGETVPDKFPSTVPIERRYSMRPAFGISYRLPLP